MPPPSELELPLRIPGRYRLQFHLGVLTELIRSEQPSGLGLPKRTATEKLSTDGVRFEVAFRPAGKNEEPLVVRHLDPTGRAGDRGWSRAEVDLASFAGASGELIFRTHGSEDPDGPQDTRADLAFVADPMLVAAAGRAPGQQPNVLLIGVDTLRADHLSAYGYARPTSPNLERLGTEGIRFERAFATAPWTLPSFSSILTSLYPSRHGAGRGGRGGYTRVSPEAVLISEVFYSAGYLTAGKAFNPFLEPAYGLVQGYTTYECPNYSAFGDLHEALRGGAFENAEADAGHIVEFLRQNRDVPFFLFWHIFDPHLPYLASDEHTRRFVDPAYDGRYKDYLNPFELVHRPGGRRRFAHEGPPPIPAMTDADARHIVNLYDAEIAETDAAVGRVLDALKELGLWQDTIVAFVADHGEGLADHGHYHHGYTLYEDQIRVPLILHLPGGPRGEVVRENVSTVDLGPMILAAAGIPVPPDMQGTDRLGAGRNRGESRPVFSESATYDSSALKAVYVDEEKYLHDPVFGREEVFHPRQDPGESENLLDQSTAFVARARPLLDRFREHNLAGGRYHLRLAAETGSRVAGRLVAGEVFDANALLHAGGDVTDVEFDHDRRTLRFEAPIPKGGAELVFWFRGDELRLELTVDGRTLSPSSIRAGDTAPDESGTVMRSRIPTAFGAAQPSPASTPGAVLWLEASGLHPLETATSPEQLERLRALGYVESQ